MTQLSVNIKKVRRHSSALESTICLQTSNLISIFDFCKNAINKFVFTQELQKFCTGIINFIIWIFRDNEEETKKRIQFEDNHKRLLSETDNAKNENLAKWMQNSIQLYLFNVFFMCKLFI